MKKKKLNSKIPIAVKISPDIKENEIEKISEILIKNNIFAAIISNSSDSNRQNLKNINKLERGGLSGKPIEKKSNELISKFYKYLKDKVIIIGVGGVDSGRSVYEKITNGASLVQLYTGMIYKGPNIVSKISESLDDILKKEGIKNISEIVGTKK